MARTLSPSDQGLSLLMQATTVANVVKMANNSSGPGFHGSGLLSPHWGYAGDSPLVALRVPRVLLSNRDRAALR